MPRALARQTSAMRKQNPAPVPFSTATEAFDDVLNKLEASEAQAEKRQTQMDEARRKSDELAALNEAAIVRYLDLATKAFGKLVTQSKARDREAAIQSALDPKHTRIAQNDNNTYKFGAAIHFQHARGKAEISIWRSVNRHTQQSSSTLYMFASTNADREDRRFFVGDLPVSAGVTENTVDLAIRQAIDAIAKHVG
jgi:hypothetical protein